MQGAKKTQNKTKNPVLLFAVHFLLQTRKHSINDFVNLKSKLKSRIMYRTSSAKSVHL